ncbi:methyltransferase domain-containing protein [Methylocapsa palsarum]|uniref:Methyltransferase domain-containing protein n=1 Tax=Methylocapsa palsarum TaxID=1612308 RepID=A0A1I4A8D7_9HYPH|nr:methyltransferase domain-containing protein [Methylocapsa palsarum]SFK52668.1 Methyltransferase domain-containing protein [Methylocapsa palsarum]
MAAPPTRIFDRGLIRRRQARALAQSEGVQGDQGADFLLRYAIDDICERRGAVKRDFTSIIDLGTPSPALAERLSAAAGAGFVARVAPLVRTLGGARLLSVVGDEEYVPLATARFDLAVSALALHYANDLPGALVQIRHALKPDGLFLGCLLGGRSLNELRTALAAAETEICGGVSPRVAPFADVRDLGGLLQRAGFALPVADSEPLSVRYADMFGLMADLRAMGASNALEARRRAPPPRALFARAAQIYAERFADPDGRVRATFELIFISGWAPHESQQKPLAPGSAKMRLADALRTRPDNPDEA